MPKRRKKAPPRLYYPSLGPLPERLAPQFAGRLLVFSDASLRRQGGLAAVLFSDPAAEPLIVTRSVAPTGSNELELQACLFALQQAGLHFPGRPLALFSDNQDAVRRLNRALERGLAEDPALAEMPGATDWPAQAQIRWIKAHTSCRGNQLADQHATKAAS